MSIVTEDGTGLANAETYISVADALSYHAARGNDTWATITTTQQEQALRRGTAYMMQVYRLRWKGVRATLTQALDWPRLNVQLEDVGFGSIQAYVPNNTVPTEVKSACAEMALKAAAGELAPDLDRETSTEKVGSIEVDYVPGAPQYKRYRAIDLMLKVYFNLPGVVGKLVRS